MYEGKGTGRKRRSPLREHIPGRARRHSPFSSEEDAPLVELKEEKGLSWREIIQGTSGYQSVEEPFLGGVYVVPQSRGLTWYM